MTPGRTRRLHICSRRRLKGKRRSKFQLSTQPTLTGLNSTPLPLQIQCWTALGNPRKPHAFLTPDQANTKPWKNAWTNLNNARQQSFKPSLPRLTGVEVELVVANPGPASGEVTMALMNAEGENLAVVSKTVAVADCNHVLFLFSKGGVRVLPAQVSSIALNGGAGVFGWKYVKDGYANGAASLNGKPL